MEAAPADKQQKFALLALGLMALLAVPLYVIIGFVTIPIGLGLLMLVNGSPWVLNLYPFMFAGTLSGRTPIYFFDDGIGILLTVVQWVVIGWWFARRTDHLQTRGATLRKAAGLIVVIAILNGILLRLFGLQAVWEGARM